MINFSYKIAIATAIITITFASGQLSKLSQIDYLQSPIQQQQFQQIHQQKQINFPNLKSSPPPLQSPRQQYQNNFIQQQQQQQLQQQKNNNELMKSKQTMTISQPIIREGIRVTLSEPSIKYLKLENIIGVLDRVAYAISKPTTIVNIVRFITLALSSLIMSSFIFPFGGLNSLIDINKKSRKERFNKFNPLNQITRVDLENMIDLMSRNYDDTLNRAGLLEKSSCRERSLCVLGDMVSCEFPNVVLTVGKFAHNHLPPIDINRNKYTKALELGFNQTDCDQAYKLTEYECPTFKDYVRSYFYGGARRRRDHNHWKKQH